MSYFDIQEARRQKRHGERDDENIDDALADGFAMLADDDLMMDDSNGARSISSLADSQVEEDTCRRVQGK